MQKPVFTTQLARQFVPNYPKMLAQNDIQYMRDVGNIAFVLPIPWILTLVQFVLCLHQIYTLKTIIFVITMII